MNIEKIEMQATVREGYQILLRARAEINFFEDKPKMREFYQRMADTCMRWAEEVYGKSLQKDFLELEGIRERSQFQPQSYHLRIHSPWQEGKYAAILCESKLLGQWREPQKSYHRISHVWNLEEELILPFPQILKRFGVHLSKEMLPFRPDGIYPLGEQMIVFRNVTDHTPFLEKRIPRSIKKNS